MESFRRPDRFSVAKRWRIRLGHRRLTRRLVALPAVAVAATLVFVLASGAVGTGTPTIQSDAADYNPGQIVTLTGTDWNTDAKSGPVHIVVNDSVGSTWQHTADVTPADDGTITDEFALPARFISDYSVKATQQTDSGQLSAASSFRRRGSLPAAS